MWIALYMVTLLGLTVTGLPTTDDEAFIASLLEGLASAETSLPKEGPNFSIANSILDFSTSMSSAHLSGGNLVFSPLSIVGLLNLFLLGSSGNTSGQIRQSLQYPTSVDDLLIHRQSAIQLQAVQASSPGNQVNIANRVFIDDTFQINDLFVSNSKSFYNASVERLSFSRNNAQATDWINQWVNNSTSGLIPKVLSEPISPLTRLVGANVIYFNSSWAMPFDPKGTTPQSFRVSDNETIKVDIMITTQTLPYVAFERYSVLALPYSGGAHSMYVFLPDGVGEEHLIELERSLDSKTIGEVVNMMKPQEVNVFLPRFKVDYSIELSSILQKMGIKDLFSPQADLDKLTSSEGVFLSEVIHQAVIEVTEEGTEAAAVTMGLANRGRLTTEFRARKPFLFFIGDTRTGVPLFWGRLVRPTASAST